jgi:hypothetical protein
MKWKTLYNDLKGVLLKHFKPGKPEPDGPAVSLIRMIQSIQRQQQGVNQIRVSTSELVGLLQDNEVLKELHRLEAMAPTPKDEQSVEPHKLEDPMFG